MVLGSPQGTCVHASALHVLGLSRLLSEQAHNAGAEVVSLFSEPKTLREFAESVGYSAADVAFQAQLDESTLSRLWDDPSWVTRIRGNSLMALIRVLPDLGEYVTSHALGTHRSELVLRLADLGLTVDQEVFRHLVSQGYIPEQHVSAALDATAYILKGDTKGAAGRLSRFWRLGQDRALAAVFAPPDRDGVLPDGRGLIIETSKLVDSSIKLFGQLTAYSNSFHAILAYACLAHHLARVTKANLLENLNPESRSDRQRALAYRSIVMGQIVQTDDGDLVDEWTAKIAQHRPLALIEGWALPSQMNDITASANFYLPRRVALVRTANEILDHIRIYNDSYFRYLVTTAIPNALSHDPSFGGRRHELAAALSIRLDRAASASTLTKPAMAILANLKDDS